MNVPGRSGDRRDPGLLLLRALLSTAPPGSTLELAEMTSVAWASATFVGARHTIELTAGDGAALASWLADLPEASLRLRGHLLIDLAVVAVARCGGDTTIAIEALTVEEA